jgi:hypothetical protein
MIGDAHIESPDMSHPPALRLQPVAAERDLQYRFLQNTALAPGGFHPRWVRSPFVPGPPMAAFPQIFSLPARSA